VLFILRFQLAFFQFVIYYPASTRYFCSSVVVYNLVMYWLPLPLAFLTLGFPYQYVNEQVQISGFCAISQTFARLFLRMFANIYVTIWITGRLFLILANIS